MEWKRCFFAPPAWQRRSCPTAEPLSATDAEPVVLPSLEEARAAVSTHRETTISAGVNHTVALKTDGTVVAVGSSEHDKSSVDDWSDIVAVSAGSGQTIGLKADGTVVAVGSNDYRQCDVSDWAEIVAISAGYEHTVGLRSDGTMFAVGNNRDNRCNVGNWREIALPEEEIFEPEAEASVFPLTTVRNEDTICVGLGHTVGLKTDGTVIAVGLNDFGNCNVSGWTDVVSISAGWTSTVGLRPDGTVISVGSNEYGMRDLDDWTDIALPPET